MKLSRLSPKSSLANFCDFLILAGLIAKGKVEFLDVFLLGRQV